MTYTEFFKWATAYGLTAEDVTQLDYCAWNDAWDAHEGQNIDTETLHDMGRQFITDMLSDEPSLILEYLNPINPEDIERAYRFITLMEFDQI